MKPKLHVAIVVGTRPEIIKMCPVIRELEKKSIKLTLIHSNQHYSPDMDEIFFKELGLPVPHYNLGVGSGKHSNQTGNILIKIEPILESICPDIVLVQGDTNTVLAAALAASKLGIKLGHVEAGLRSYDRTMPEETNRITTDHLADLLFAVSSVQLEILQAEGIEKAKIKVVGNTITDAALQNLEASNRQSKILDKHGLKEQNFMLITAHRANNVDRKENLSRLLDNLKSLANQTKLPAIWPIHPRTLKKINEFKLEFPSEIIQIGPVGYLDFLQLEAKAKIIVTDSGGVQEEACILGVPCLTVRENTERPETIEVGANKIVGLDKELLLSAASEMLSTNLKWKNPFGDGKSALKIVESIQAYFDSTFVKSNSELKKISVVGMGYMGLPTAAILANAGHQVRGFDIDPQKVKLIQQKKIFENEPGMGELLDRAFQNNFEVSTELNPADVFIVAVPTPIKEKKCDLTYVVKACESVAEVAKAGDLIIIESTIRPGTCDEVVLPLFTKKGINVHVAHCPERAIPGNTLNELIYNDRIIGGVSAEATAMAKSLYESFARGDLYTTTASTAETAKLVENTFRDVNIAFSNELATVCEEIGVNVWEVIELANKHPRVNILQPGPGVGGHCIAVDPWFLVESSDQAQLIKTARQINDNRPEQIVQKVMHKLEESGGSKVGILGVAYKKNVDDCRETPAQAIYNSLLEKGKEVKVFDPFVQDWNSHQVVNFEELHNWAEVLVLVTDHDYFKQYKVEKPLVDTRNFYAEKDF